MVSNTKKTKEPFLCISSRVSKGQHRRGLVHLSLDPQRRRVGRLMLNVVRMGTKHSGALALGRDGHLPFQQAERIVGPREKSNGKHMRRNGPVEQLQRDRSLGVMRVFVQHKRYAPSRDHFSPILTLIARQQTVRPDACLFGCGCGCDDVLKTSNELGKRSKRHLF